MENKSAKSVKDRVIELVAKSLDLDLNTKSITETSEFVKDLGADSLHLVELIMMLEEEFGVEIPDDKASEMKKIGDVIEYIKEAIESK